MSGGGLRGRVGCHLVRQVRLSFTEPSPTDGLARVFEVDSYGTR
ncbi:hypothetical protein ACQSSU_21000 [Micromonospora echinospora]